MKTFNELKLAQELIKFQTIKTEDKGIMKFLSKKLSSLGFKCQIIKSKGTSAKPALNLYAKFGKSKPNINYLGHTCLLYTSPSPRDQRGSRMPSSA